jgi:hypothetical protein
MKIYYRLFGAVNVHLKSVWGKGGNNPKTVSDEILISKDNISLNGVG